MDADSHEIVDVATLVEGFDRAVRRFMEGGRLSAEPQEAFFSIFEALNWAVAIDDRLGAETGGNRDWAAGLLGAPVVVGIRYARNRVHHQWAQALYLDSRGAELPVPLPMPFFEWRWKRLPQRGRDKRGASEYRDHLVDKAARNTLQELSELFAIALVRRLPGGGED